MKAISHFYGNDSLGNSIEVAQGVDGSWFFREYGWNGYGNSWSKWEKTSGPKFENGYTNPHNGEYCEYSKPQAFWGFSKLYEVKPPHRIRLPNP